MRVLTEYDLENNTLEGLKALVLPNVACLSDRAAEVIRRYVRRGDTFRTLHAPVFIPEGAGRCQAGSGLRFRGC